MYSLATQDPQNTSPGQGWASGTGRPGFNPRRDRDAQEEEMEGKLYTLGSTGGDWSETVERLEEADVSVESVYPKDISQKEGEIRIDGVPVSEFEEDLFEFRPSTFFSNIEGTFESLDEEEKSKYDGVEDYKQEKWSLVQRMEKEAGLDFLSDPHLMEYIEHKGDAKELYSMMDVRTAESYDILDAVEKLRNGEPVIAKPVDKNQGEGVELLYPQETEQSAWNMLTGYLERESEDLPEALENVEFEEYIDITQEENKEKRMYFVGDKAMIAYKEHPNIDEGFIAQNSHNGGEYTDQHAVMEGPEDLDKLSPSERDIYRAGKQVGGIHAVDYIDQEGGEAVFIEDNGCPGHGTNGPVDVDIPELEKEEIVEQMNSHHKRMLN